MKPLPYATLVILMLTAWVTWRAFTQRSLFERLLFRPDRVLGAREYYRLLSSALLHADWVHFFFNAITLVAFGELIEHTFGIPVFGLIYVGSILGGSLLALAMHRHHEYSAVGASGGVCGVMFAHIFLFPGSEVSLFILPIYVPAWIYVVLFLAYSFSGMYRQRDNIGHDAHLGGALVGLGITTALYPNIIRDSPWLWAGVVVVTLIFFIFLARHPHSSLRTLFTEIRYSRPSASQPRHRRHEAAFDRVTVKGRLDELLDKVARGGIQKLTAAERRELEQLSQQLRK